MSDRVKRIKEYVNNIFDNIEDSENKRSAYVHSYGVSHCCALLAVKRGLDMELAAIIGLLHDVYRYKTGITPLHAVNGAEMVRVAIKYILKDIFSEDEQTIIKSAIYHHSDKKHVHDVYDELLKDSGVFSKLPLNNTYGELQARRLRRVLNELSLPVPEFIIIPDETTPSKSFNRQNMADIAETLAKSSITGDKSDAEFMEIIRYYPEESIFDGLKNAWCAAFIYHCCVKAGLVLAIRVPHTANKTANSRFNGVGGWYEWGVENGFCHFEKDSFIPERGDIVIYNNIIPPEDKEENGRWHDHTGIVLSCDGNSLTVAEGNVGNKNVSGIQNRKRDNTIGCYVRIPDGYSFDGEKIDYKTGETKIVKFTED